MTWRVVLNDRVGRSGLHGGTFGMTGWAVQGYRGAVQGYRAGRSGLQGGSCWMTGRAVQGYGAGRSG